MRAFAHDFEQTLSDRIYHFGATMQRGSLPFTIQRARALLEWYESGGLTQASVAVERAEPRCPACSELVRGGTTFCGRCGARLSAVT